jgi:hypothetical protein
MTIFHPRMINAHQTKEQAQAKYWYCRSAGLNSHEARRMRSWDQRYIEWFIERWINRKDPDITFSELRTQIIAERKLAFEAMKGDI